MHRVGLALGSNLGDKLHNLSAARKAIAELSTPETPLLSAPIYQTAPIDCQAGDPDFYNTVIEGTFAQSAQELLSLTQQIELSMGRGKKGIGNLPRLIDIDILYYSDQEISTPQLEIPHPRITQRRFVLEPLAWICPDLILPGHGRSISSLLKNNIESPLQKLMQTW